MTTSLSQETNSVMNVLVGYVPGISRPTMTRKQLKELLLYTDGWMMNRGAMCDIRSKHLGAGVYQVWLEARA